jgi:hypothetical protein
MTDDSSTEYFMLWPGKIGIFSVVNSRITTGKQSNDNRTNSGKDAGIMNVKPSFLTLRPMP